MKLKKLRDLPPGQLRAVRERIAEDFNVDVEQIPENPDALVEKLNELSRNMGADSLDRVELVMEFEEEFDVILEDTGDDHSGNDDFFDIPGGPPIAPAQSRRPNRAGPIAPAQSRRPNRAGIVEWSAPEIAVIR